MNVLKIIAFLSVLICSFPLMAEEPTSKEEQCAQYGSYQDEDGNWQVCEVDETSDSYTS